MHLAVVIPVQGRPDLLKRCLDAIELAIVNHRETELILVDNNPLATFEPLLYDVKRSAMVVRSAAGTIGAVRNEGVLAVEGNPEVVVFIDSDCEVNPDFLARISAIFTAYTHIAIAGCKVKSPANGHWTEVASDETHRDGGDGPRSHLNSGCMAIRAALFERVGGFSPDLPANEDYDLCDRVRGLGGKIWQFESLAVTHLGNPKTVAAFIKRLRWHGRGVFTADGRFSPTLMAMAVLANSTVVLFGIAVSTILMAKQAWLAASLCFLVSLLVMPTAFWFLRTLQFRRWIRPHYAVPLMQITFFARQLGMIEQYLLLMKQQRRS